MRYVIALLFLAGCASQKMTMTAYPSAGAIPAGRGTFDPRTEEATLTIGQSSYRGKLPYDSRSRAITKVSGVLRGDSGELRCALTFVNRREAMGACVDAQDRSYDVLMR